MGQVYQCWWRICREIHDLSRFEYHMFYVLYQNVTYLLTSPSYLLGYTAGYSGESKPTFRRNIAYIFNVKE
jgi:hypothetical protein